MPEDGQAPFLSPSSLTHQQSNTGVQHEGFNSKAKQNSKGNGAVVHFSIAREGTG